MNGIHAGLFFVLLLLPNTTLRDWQDARAPHLQFLMVSGSMALMNARTAEVDKITPTAGIYTLMAGARMGADGRSEGLDYPARRDNLPAALEAAGVELTPELAPTPNPSPNNEGRGKENPALPISLPLSLGEGWPKAGIGAIGEKGSGRGGQFVVVNLGGDPAKADAAIGQWADLVAKRGGELMVVSPNPSPSEYVDDDQLTPVALWGPKIPAGILISPSTHQPGLVTNTDIAPTIAAYFHAHLPVEPFGAPVTAAQVSEINTVGVLAQREALWQSEERERHAVPYIAAALALLVTGATFFGWKTGRNIGPIAVFIAALPFALLMSNAIPVFISLTISAIGGAFVLRDRSQNALFWLSGVIALVVIADALFNAGGATARSLLGYSPMEGARYYGIGNEAMGALVGALVVVTGGLTQRKEDLKRNALGVVLLWLAAGFDLGWPAAGAKAGGFFVALVALAVFAWSASGQSFAKPLPWIASILGICILGALLALAGRFVGHTHIGQAVQLAHAQGMAAIRSLIERKVGMDAHLVFHSAWALVLLTAGIGAALLYRKRELGQKIGGAAMATGVAAAAACLALNDAGVVAAAICSLYLWAALAVSPASESQAYPAAAASSQ